jgi:hypothetical protein
MTLPDKSVTFTAEQISELNRELSHMRHDINNHLSLMIAAVELIRHKPQSAERMLDTLSERPQQISESMKKFSAQFEKSFGILRR